MTQNDEIRDTRRMAAILQVTGAVIFAASPLFVGGFNGFAPDQFPVPQVDVPVQPAGYAFSIWGLIYVWLIAAAGYGLFQRSDASDWAGMRLPLTASLVVGAGWIPAAQASVPVATVMIWVMWALAVWALLRAGQSDRWWQRVPVALYAGWLTAASCVALGLVLGGYGVMSNTAAAVLCIVLALTLALAVQRARPDEPMYAVAVIWALIGIIMANLSVGPLPVAMLAGLGAALLAAQAARGKLAG
ncbi:hypothetical protein [Lacimonas salitolerans]|uniref:TspO and MBR related proteins n=1 Tax=Lacimonas salitolerans TaxID=1323750 RepID=A0ABW4ED00_9RHOB